MNKRTFIFVLFFILYSFCFAEEIKSIKIELHSNTQAKQIQTIYDSNSNNDNYPFKIFCDCLNGWGRKGGLKKIIPLFVPKNLPPEGVYIVYVTTSQGKNETYRLMNFKTIQNVRTQVYYETDFLKYLYEFIVQKYLQTL